MNGDQDSQDISASGNNDYIPNISASVPSDSEINTGEQQYYLLHTPDQIIAVTVEELQKYINEYGILSVQISDSDFDHSATTVVTTDPGPQEGLDADAEDIQLRVQNNLETGSASEASYGCIDAQGDTATTTRRPAEENRLIAVKFCPSGVQDRHNLGSCGSLLDSKLITSNNCVSDNFANIETSCVSEEFKAEKVQVCLAYEGGRINTDQVKQVCWTDCKISERVLLIRHPLLRKGDRRSVECRFPVTKGGQDVIRKLAVFNGDNIAVENTVEGTVDQVFFSTMSSNSRNPGVNQNSSGAASHDPSVPGKCYLRGGQVQNHQSLLYGFVPHDLKLTVVDGEAESTLNIGNPPAPIAVMSPTPNTVISSPSENITHSSTPTPIKSKKKQKKLKKTQEVKALVTHIAESNTNGDLNAFEDPNQTQVVVGEVVNSPAVVNNLSSYCMQNDAMQNREVPQPHVSNGDVISSNSSMQGQNQALSNMVFDQMQGNGFSHLQLQCQGQLNPRTVITSTNYAEEQLVLSTSPQSVPSFLLQPGVVTQQSSPQTMTFHSSASPVYQTNSVLSNSAIVPAQSNIRAPSRPTIIKSYSNKSKQPKTSANHVRRSTSLSQESKPRLPSLTRPNPTYDGQNSQLAVKPHAFEGSIRTSNLKQIQILVDNDSKATSSITPVEPFNRERYIEGKEVLCKNCGVSTRDLYFCESCKRRIPEEIVLMDRDPSLKTLVKSSPRAKSIPQSQRPTATLLVPSNCPTSSPGTSLFRPTKGKGKRSDDIITLSSDDEDQPQSKIAKLKAAEPSVTSNSQNKSPNRIKITMDATVNQPVPPPLASPKEELDMDARIAEIQDSLSHEGSGSKGCAKFTCRSIRVGDYKCVGSKTQPLEAVFVDKGIVFNVNHAEQSARMVKCILPTDTLLLCQGCFNKNLSVIFVIVGPKHANLVRKRIGLSDDPKDIGLYFGSEHGDKYQKRITFILESVAEADPHFIKSVFAKCFGDIDYSEANRILVDITRGDPSKPTTGPSIGKSTLPSNVAGCGPSPVPNKISSAIRPQSQKPAPSTSQVDVTQNKILLLYEEMEVRQQDILCLSDEQFLNDSVIDFWLKYVERDLLSPVDRKRTHFFSTFFYKRLTTKTRKGTEDPNISRAEQRHNRVKRWTKNVDIFEKDFLIVPINENLHWFLAVICFPGLVGVHNMATGEEIHDYIPPPAKRQTKAKKPPVSVPSTPSSEDAVVNGQSGIADTVPAQSESTSSPSPLPSAEMPSSSAQPAPVRKRNKVNIKQPCIIVFDSLAGESRSRIYSTLREYLKIEYKTRKGEDREFTKVSMPSGMPKVPQQPNHCDCGLYTLLYVELFFNQPIPSFEFPIEDSPAIWKNYSCDGKREAIFNTIRDLVSKRNPDMIICFPNLVFAQTPVCNQIALAPFQKIEKVTEAEEQMDVDVGSTSSSVRIDTADSTQESMDSQVSSTTLGDHDYASKPK